MIDELRAEKRRFDASLECLLADAEQLAESGGGKSTAKPKKTRTKMTKKAKADEKDEYLNNLNLIHNNVSTLKNMVLEMDEACESKSSRDTT